MKSILFTLAFLLCGAPMSQAESLTLKENQIIEVCGYLLSAGSIWQDAGQTKIDLIVQEKPNFKPISGGYAFGDKIDVDYANSGKCLYYVSSITKSPSTEKPGTVTLSKTPPKK